MITHLTILILTLVFPVILAWNLWPPFRQRMRGLSTIAEAVIGTVAAVTGILQDVIDQARAAGAPLPEDLRQIVPFILLAWIVAKRLQTTTPAGPRR